MNLYEQRMLEILTELKENYGAIAVKSEFEAEGASVEEIERVSWIAFRSGMDSYIKIGGCEAISDMNLCRSLGAKGIIAPMIESAFAMEKYLSAIERVFSVDEQKNMIYNFNAETITGYDNLDAILAVDGIEKITTMVIGRSDFTCSLGYGKDMVNSDEITDYTRSMLEKAAKFGLSGGIGGNMTSEASAVIHSMKDILQKYETRKIVFDYDESIDIEKGIQLALEFEILYLKNNMEHNSEIASASMERIDNLQERIG